MNNIIFLIIFIIKNVIYLKLYIFYRFLIIAN